LGSSSFDRECVNIWLFGWVGGIVYKPSENFIELERLQVKASVAELLDWQSRRLLSSGNDLWQSRNANGND
jgi:hypothetical protein